MEARHNPGKVTLPPLSSLTTSIDMDRRYERPSSRRDSFIDRGEVRISPDMPLSSSSYRDEFSRPLPPDDRRWSIDRTAASTIPEGMTTFPASNHHVATTSNASISPLLQRAPMRSVVESSTRPRSYSSPHRHRMSNPTRRSSLADTSEVDRLLESLIYVQDINRRLGLDAGCPASPSIFRDPGAADMLRGKLQDELNIMAHFSHSRAESVARHLGVSTYQGSARRANEGSYVSHRDPASSTVSSGQAGYPMRPPSDYPERAQSSLGRLSLEDRHNSEFEYDSYSEVMETDYETDQSGYNLGGPSAYAMHSTRGEPPFRTLSRAASFEQPRTVQHAAPHPHHYSRAAAELPRFDGSARMPYDSSMQPPYGPGNLPSYYHPDSRHQQQMELLDRRRLAGKGMKRVRKRKNEHHQECLGCQAKETPEWRKGPMGPRTLCNACGLLYAKLTKRKLQEAEAAAKATGKTAEEIVREREESPGAKQASLEALRAELNLANGMRNRVASSTAPADSAFVGESNSVLPGSSLGYGPPVPQQQRRHHPYM